MKKLNFRPIWKEINVDLETPVSTYLKLRHQGARLLLESVEKGEDLGRYSFISFNPSQVIRIKKNRIELNGHQISFTKENFLPTLRKLIFSYHLDVDESLPPILGGWIGYLGYELVPYFESVEFRDKPGLNLPDALLYLVKDILIFDHLKHSAKIITLKEPRETKQEALRRIDLIVKTLEKPLPLSSLSSTPIHSQKSNLFSLAPLSFDRRKFYKKVEKIKGYILAGDIFQAVISQRIKRETKIGPFQIYRALRTVNPSPYMFFLDFGDFQLIGSSPETLVKLTNGMALVHPIAGTRPRGKTLEEERQLEEELLANEKELAEHIMLVDLARNDLGKVCLPHSIKLEEMMNIEKYSHVMHIVSRVTGTLHPELNALELLKAAFPAGTVTGAPKIRAMEIIEELEECQRGPYAGAIGYFGLGGNMDMCIGIRIIIYCHGIYYLQAGAGIVADSEPEREYLEVINKMQGLEKAIKLAEEGG